MTLKRAAMFLFSLALAVLAFTTTSQPANAVCTGPACFASPSCCLNSQCDTWCGGAGLGRCSGTPQNGGGCCYCPPPES